MVSVYLTLGFPDQCVIYFMVYWVWPPVSVESVCLPSLPWCVNKHSSLGNRRHSHLPLFYCHVPMMVNFCGGKEGKCWWFQGMFERSPTMMEYEYWLILENTLASV